MNVKIVMFDLPVDLVVSTRATNSLIANTTCLQCPLIFEDLKFLKNLGCLELVQLNVILGMNWLTLHHVVLDCTKTVMFPVSGVADYLNSFALKKGSLAFLNSIVAEEKRDSDIRSIPIVQDDAYVFPEDVPGLPPL